ncbi:tyrosine--tRNA ligase [Candidatus Woesebacteria bacterium RIFOXYC1_FULL_31_51]|uniref:Tyrosine--tRNA ligase n=1 Tax=Candidatus Woesebacteria bacterium GW2011_GWC2_31_9 TaxID=1618586 RepID=A0A0F9YJ27_9BACT|nr:MAG: tyrosyl-tRNA synthetase, tyrosyl-tRNA synthetase [Candidatus Woesebacteria bacterium GW2011_GWF1_31_35]KKP22693.1 MAG: Tyrosine-tRNA ligase [Candidatus Woesebacteria bacterium GW2011_GWC1_30_29]KKP25924.1 MAG: Tyrosine-tRNA ligase [Candidatus Woesebacteria bacterium GW2011_GWD1_31_12]KKP27150.1 MAG: Tyrosine-tRNA ligase [Candidatus Woesebacteria bacterium GW2011_GWB1_31_29]KKP31529.1 MAG: Tyrosine-tRNA ligase [Candidatus Woesebacteria bacterium GW2011_GWC2_31_9]KKP33941.1 MAG: Tyrosine
MNNIEEVLTRGVQQVLPDKKELTLLMAKEKIKLYQGFDPSAPSLHLGNFVGLMKLRQFQKLGHEVIFLVGDFTGMIGDPTDKLTARKKLTREQVLENAKVWKEQASKVLDFDGENPAKIMFNSEWLDKLSSKDLIEVSSNLTHQQMIERDMYQERIKKGEVIYFHELLYPIFQGYDSVAMDVDLEIGGNDQLFNMMIGRTLMKAIKGKEKFVLTTKLLVDKKGKKVGKTTGNALFLDSKPEDFYAGIMSFPDEVIFLGFELLTETNLDGIEEKIKNNPMEEKKRLAFEIVKFLWGEKKASDSTLTFENNFQKKDPEFINEIKIKENLAETIAPFTNLKSSSDAKRLILQGGVSINDKVVTYLNYKIKKGDNIKIGKKTFGKLI